jgi:hypothetical protein
MSVKSFGNPASSFRYRFGGTGNRASRILVPTLGTQTNPATSATALKASGVSTNGAYWYSFSGGVTRQLYTDFTTYSNYPMVMATRLSSADNLQYLTTENNPGDLSSTPTNGVAPSRSAKLSDSQLNEIIVANTIRWVILGQFAVFYRMNDNWTSNFGTPANCSYTTGYYQNYATPSNTPTWLSFGIVSGGCGGGYDRFGNNWLLLTGIHTNDAGYTGGYTGNSSDRGSAPSQYTAGSYANDTWNVPGYVFLSW